MLRCKAKYERRFYFDDCHACAWIFVSWDLDIWRQEDVPLVCVVDDIYTYTFGLILVYVVK